MVKLQSEKAFSTVVHALFGYLCQRSLLVTAKSAVMKSSAQALHACNFAGSVPERTINVSFVGVICIDNQY